MLGNPFDLLPKGVGAALLVYLGLCWVLGDTFADRVADRVHVPACVSGAQAEAATSRHGFEDEAAIAREMMRDLFERMPALQELPGANVIDRLAQKQTAPTSRKASFKARCVCLATEAQRETGIDYMLWVATMKVYTPSGVRNFQGIMTRFDKAGACGEGRE